MIIILEYIVVAVWVGFVAVWVGFVGFVGCNCDILVVIQNL